MPKPKVKAKKEVKKAVPKRAATLGIEEHDEEFALTPTEDVKHAEIEMLDQKNMEYQAEMERIRAMFQS